MQQAIAQTTISTGDYDVAEEYRAMIKPEMELGIRISNPLMWKYVQAANDDSFILDAPCGTGPYSRTLFNMGKDFRVAVSDASPKMLEYTQTRLSDLGHVAETHLAKLDQFTQNKMWKNRFQLALVPNVASELFGDMPEEVYEQHLIGSLIGVKSVLEKGGIALIDARDWEETLKRQWDKTTRENKHDNVIYHAEYDWIFGSEVNSVHTAYTKFWNERDGFEKARNNIIRFAGRTKDQLETLFNKAGFEVIETARDLRGNNNEPFITFALTAV